MSGWIKIHRQLLDWEWYSDTNCRLLFLHCLLKANFEDTKWRGVNIKKGSFISSLGNLAKSTGMSVRTLRTTINKLKSTSELTSKGHAEYTMFTIVKYNQYQSTDKPTVKLSTSNRQSTDKQPTTVKEEKEFKELKNLKEDRVDLINLYLFSESFRPTWDRWIEYKKNEHKATFKRIETQQTAFKHLLELSKNNESTAEKIIEQSIANQWKGLFELKNLPNGKPQKRSLEQATRDYLAQ